jgi:hypothetical protein
MTADTHRNTNDKTPAQMYSLVFGATLLLAGIAGFFVNSDFNTGSNIDGDKLIFFEVNAIHNLIHLASGAVGLAMAKRADTAKTFALGFGLVYLLVTIVGLIDGKTFLGLIPINPADNILHIAISAAGIAAYFASRGDHRAARTA